MPRSPRLALALALAAHALLGACRSAPAAGAGAPPAAGARTLAALAEGARVVVLPTRYLDVDPAVRWPALRDSARVLDDFDRELRFAFEERGVGGSWVWPDAVRRAAQRSAGALPDPSTWDAHGLRRARSGDAAGVPESVRSHLRALAALHGARYVLYPILLDVAPERAGGAGGASPRGSVRLAVIDVRTATVDWVGTVAGAPASAYGAALPASVASKVADLVAPQR